MNLLRLAFQAAGEFRGKLIWLTVQSFLVALLEAVTLLLLFAFVSGLIAQGVNTGQPTTIGLTSSLLKHIDPLTQAAIILALASVRFLFTLSIEWQVSKLWVDMRSVMQQCMLSRHLGARLEFIMSKKMGEHVHHIMDGPSFAAVFYLHLIRFSSTAIMLVVLLATLSIISIKLMVLAFCIAIFYGAVVKKISGSLSYDMGRRQAIAIKSQAALANEGVAGIRYIKMLNGIERWIKQFSLNAQEAAYAMQRAGFWNTVPSRAIEYLVLVFFLGLVIYSLSNKQNFLLDIPTVAIYFLAIVRILPSLSIIGNGRMQMMQTLPYLQKYIELETTLPQELSDHKSRQLPDVAAAKIHFKDVSFAYTDVLVLDKVSFNIPPRTVTAIVGESGQGKSTLLDILVGFLKPSSGDIKIEELPIGKVDLDSWRSKFSYVGQDTFLFHDTLRENIRFSNPAASDKEIYEACELAGAGDFLAGFTQGLDTMLADRGASISGGQRQRIAIARALVSPAKILLFDEPTSALDGKTERLVIENLIKHKNDRRVVLITHKTELLEYADQILVLKNGKISKAKNPADAVAMYQTQE